MRHAGSQFPNEDWHHAPKAKVWSPTAGTARKSLRETFDMWFGLLTLTAGGKLKPHIWEENIQQGHQEANTGRLSKKKKNLQWRPNKVSIYFSLGREYCHRDQRKPRTCAEEMFIPVKCYRKSSKIRANNIQWTVPCGSQRWKYQECPLHMFLMGQASRVSFLGAESWVVTPREGQMNLYLQMYVAVKVYLLHFLWCWNFLPSESLIV